MSTVKLTRVFRKDKETKYGIKPQVSIQTEQHGDKWLSTFKTQGTENWNEGDTVDIEVSEHGDFLNFKPKGTGSTGSSLPNNVEDRLQKLERAVFGQPEPKETVIQADAPEEEDGLEGSF